MLVSFLKTLPYPLGLRILHSWWICRHGRIDETERVQLAKLENCSVLEYGRVADQLAVEECLGVRITARSHSDNTTCAIETHI